MGNRIIDRRFEAQMRLFLDPFKTLDMLNSLRTKRRRLINETLSTNNGIIQSGTDQQRGGSTRAQQPFL